MALPAGQDWVCLASRVVCHHPVAGSVVYRLLADVHRPVVCHLLEVDLVACRHLEVCLPTVGDKAAGVPAEADANPTVVAGEAEVEGNRADDNPAENPDSSRPTSKD